MVQFSETSIDMDKKTSSFTGGIEFSSLTYSVIKKTKDENGKWVKKKGDLLHGITGYAPKGCVTAVMGPSGAGKSTFLDALAGRISSGSLKGRVRLEDGVEDVINGSSIKRRSAYIMQDDKLFPMLTVYETLMFAADFKLGSIPRYEKIERVEKLIEQLGLSTSRNTYIGDEGTRGVSGGERRRVSIGVDIIHGPTLLFLDEPTSGLDSTSAHSVIEKVHDIARSGSTVILTIHQPSSRIQLLLDHLLVLARGQLMYQGSPKDVTFHLRGMGRKIPKGENSIEYLIDVIQEYDQSNFGVGVLAKFCITGTKPPLLDSEEILPSNVVMSPTVTITPSHRQNKGDDVSDNVSNIIPLHIKREKDQEFDNSVRSPWNTSTSWSQSGYIQALQYTPTRGELVGEHRMSPANDYYAYSSDTLQGIPTPQRSDYTLNENDYATPEREEPNKKLAYKQHQGPKFTNSFFIETWILMRRNFKNIKRTPELFLSRLIVLTVMGVMMSTMFHNPKRDLQGITNTLSFFIFTVCLFFFSSNDAVPAFIQERFIFIRETSHNAYRASSYTIAGLITYLPFLAVQATVYGLIVWFGLKLRGPFLYFLLVLYMSLISTNSFVVFVSSIVPNYILGYASVIAFTAIFFLFCGYFLNSHDIPKAWKWMNYISTITYPYEGLLMNQFQTPESFGLNPIGLNVTGFGILKSLSIEIEESKKWEKIYVMIGWAVVYRVLFYIVLRFFSKSQRT